jgi:hypothetical protein
MKTCKFPDCKPSFLHADDAVVGVASLWTLLSDPAGASKPMQKKRAVNEGPREDRMNVYI